MKRFLVGIVLAYGLAIVMLGTFAYLDHAFPKHTTPAMPERNSK